MITDDQGQAILDQIVEISSSPLEAMELCASMPATFIYHHIPVSSTENFLVEYLASIRRCIEEHQRLHNAPDGTVDTPDTEAKEPL